MADIEWNVTTAESCDKSGNLVPKHVWVNKVGRLWVEQADVISVRSHVVDRRAIREKIVETIKIGQRDKRQLVMASYLKLCTHHGSGVAVERLACLVPGLDASRHFDVHGAVTEYVGQDGIGAVSIADDPFGYYPVAFPPRSDEELTHYQATALMPICYGKQPEPAGHLALSALTRPIQVDKYLR